MGRWTREYGRRLRDAAYERRLSLIRALGGRCDSCDVTMDEEALEFDHLQPRTWKAREVNYWTRQKLYERDAANGHLGLACRRCNAGNGRPTPTSDWLGVLA